ncbi:MAG: hypothetical protein ACREIC_28250 [Limisphaerales bacterium]
MLIEIEDAYLQWVKLENPELFSPDQNEKAALEQYVNEVLRAHRQSWSPAETE